MGNSEVGHLNIGAGRVVYQDFTRIDHAIETGEFARNPVLRDAVAATQARRRDAARPGAPLARRRAQPRAADRRDGGARRRAAARRASASTRSSTAATRRRAAPRASLAYIDGVCAQHPRRAHRLDRRPLLRDGPRPALGPRRAGVRPPRRRPRAVHGADAPQAGLAAAYARGENDEFVKATAIAGPRRQAGDDGRRRRRRVHEFPRRPRAQITRALTDPAFDGFAARAACRSSPRYVCLTSYGDEFARLPVAFAPQSVAQRLRRIRRRARAHAAAHRRNREVRARHLLLQRRRRSALSGRGPHPGALAQGRDLRPASPR